MARSEDRQIAIDLERRADETRSAWRHRTARAMWEGMMELDPDGCAQVEKDVKQRVACAEMAGAFGARPASH